METIVILCGGKGARLSSVQPNTPKALKKLESGDVILELILSQLEILEFSKVILSINAAESNIFRRFLKERDIENSNLTITLFEESARLGTGGALLNLIHSIGFNEHFAVINGDTLFSPKLLQSIKDSLSESMEANLTHFTAQLWGVATMASEIFSGFRVVNPNCLTHIGCIEKIDYEELLTKYNIQSFNKNLPGHFVDLGTVNNFYDFFV
jgi:dTDP-glucose pyrophosphorylase